MSFTDATTFHNSTENNAILALHCNYNSVKAVDSNDN